MRTARTLRKAAVAATVVASVAVGGLAGTVLGAPIAAGAAETAGGAADWVQETLSGLVEDDTLTQAQADAVEAALEDARPARPMGGVGHRGGHVRVAAVAEALGLTEAELRNALGAGATIADVAGDEGVPVAEVIDAIVAAERAHLDARVAAGELTRDQADARLADAEERATALVNGDLPRGGGRHRGGHADTTDGGAGTSTTAA